MKKVVLILLMIFVIGFSNLISINATEDPTITIDSGASIRTTGNQGIRFRATLSSMPQGATRGFFLVNGSVSRDDLVTAINNKTQTINEKKIVRKTIDGTDLEISVVIYNIDEENYEQAITALAFIRLSNGTYVFSSSVTTKDIMTVAKKAYEKGTANDYIADIFHSKYVRTKYHLDYGYETITDLRDDLMNDFNEYNNSSFTIETLKDNAGDQTTRDKFSAFIGNSNYSKKWYSFFNYIATLREDRYEEIEEFASSNYDQYIDRNNINYYTPCMQRIVNDYVNINSADPKPTGYDSSKRLWILETAAFFARDGYSYWSAVSFDWAQSVYDDVYDIVLDKMNHVYEETTFNNSAITYVPTRDGYTFNGWYTASNSAFISKKQNTNASSEELHAAWVKSDTYFVDSSLDGSITHLRYNDLLFEYNVNAFNSIDKAIDKCTSGGVIYVNKGTYGNNFTIKYDNITLIGANSGVSGVGERNDESNITGVITINSGIANTVIDGFKFSGNSQVKNVAGAAGDDNSPSTNLNGFTFINNKVETTLASGNGFIYFVEGVSSYSHDLVFKSNSFEGKNNSSTMSAMIWLDNFYNLTFTDNSIKNSPKTAFRVEDTTKGASGKYVIIRNNTLDNIGYNGIDIDWLSPHPGETDAIVDISDNVLNNIGNLAVYLGKFNNTDKYQSIKVNNNVFNGFTNGVLVMRSITNATVSVSENEFHGVPASYYIKLDNTSASNPKAVNAMENLYFDSNDNFDDNYSDKFVGNINHTTLLYITQTGNGTIKLGETYNLSTNVNSHITWSSNDALVASVNSNGVVTGNSSGSATVTATSASGATATVVLTVYNASEVSPLMKLLIENHNATIWNENITYIGYQGNKVNNVNGSANNYYPGTIPNVTEKMLPTDRKNYSGVTISSLQFITIHDTGSAAASATALANANWCNNTSNTSSSWHYTIGNDGIYHQVPDNIVAWHAGDGRTTVTLKDTGISVFEGKTLRYRPTITMGDDGYFYLDGIKTLVKYPSVATPATGMNITGIGVVVKNGKYYIPTTRVTGGYGNVVAIGGGNMQSIGIETCVNDGSDVYLTWQYTAKLVAQLLVNNNLGPDRVKFHNNFSNKTCPYTMITAGKTEEFLDMCYVEYMVRKYYSDYEITFTSLNQTYLDNNGRVKTNPSVPTSVGYTITLTKGGNTESITLYTTVSPKA